MQHFATPEELVESLNIHGPRTVADFGSGAGFFALPVAERLSEGGSLWAFDIQEYPLEVLRSRARERNIENIKTIRADLEKKGGSRLKDESADLAVLAHIIFQAEHKVALLEEAFRVLKKGATLVIVEWMPDSEIGPPPEERISQEKLRERLGQMGFLVTKEFLLAKYSYGYLATKKS